MTSALSTDDRKCTARRTKYKRAESRLLASLWGKHRVDNPFIMEECKRLGIQQSRIPTTLWETYGQCNEDLILDALLAAHALRLGIRMAEINYIEIGANHPVQTSATYLFYRAYGAKGILCEANPRLAQELAGIRPRDIVVNAAICATHKKTATLHVARASELSSLDPRHVSKFQKQFGSMAEIVNQIDVDSIHINEFMNAYAQDRIDFFSLDIEGLDYEILKAMDLSRFRPSFLQVEHNANAEAFTKLLRSHDYTCIALTGVNQVFADLSLY